MATATKSINLKHDDAVGLSVIVEKDHRIERGPSEALRYCFEDAAREIPDWNDVLEKAKKLDYTIDIPESAVGITRTFLVEDKTYEEVFKSVCEQMNMKKPQVSYLTRLCIYAARLRLETGKEETRDAVKVEAVDGVSLLMRVNQKAAMLIKGGNLKKIEEFLKED